MASLQINIPNPSRRLEPSTARNVRHVRHNLASGVAELVQIIRALAVAVQTLPDLALSARAGVVAAAVQAHAARRVRAVCAWPRRRRGLDSGHRDLDARRDLGGPVGLEVEVGEHAQWTADVRWGWHGQVGRVTFRRCWAGQW